MFGIGFTELLLIAAIALVVLGPEKLPQAARTAGLWYGKIRRTISNMQSEIEAELNLAEARKQMQEELEKIKQAERNMQAQMEKMQQNLNDMQHATEKNLAEEQHKLDQAITPTQTDQDTAIDEELMASGFDDEMEQTEQRLAASTQNTDASPEVVAPSPSRDTLVLLNSDQRAVYFSPLAFSLFSLTTYHHD